MRRRNVLVVKRLSILLRRIPRRLTNSFIAYHIKGIEVDMQDAVFQAGQQRLIDEFSPGFKILFTSAISGPKVTIPNSMGRKRKGAFYGMGCADWRVKGKWVRERRFRPWSPGHVRRRRSTTASLVPRLRRMAPSFPRCRGRLWSGRARG